MIKKKRKSLNYRWHYCGNGYKGKIIYLKSKHIQFCTFCGKELLSVKNKIKGNKYVNKNKNAKNK